MGQERLPGLGSLGWTMACWSPSNSGTCDPGRPLEAPGRDSPQDPCRMGPSRA